jgi:hypothetical protein
MDHETTRNNTKSKKPVIGPDPHRAKANIDIAERDPEQAEPCEHHVTLIKRACAFPGCLLERFVSEFVASAADEMP